MVTDINRDKYGVVRGKCRDCPEDCPRYSQPVLRHNCTYCGCPAGQHERVEPRPELIIKMEPGKEGAGSPGRPVGRSQPGLSRKQDGLPTAQAQPRSSRRNKSPIVSRKHPDTSEAVTKKRCETLFEDTGVNVSLLKRNLRKTKRGVFTILWKRYIIYVGEPKKTPMLSSLRSIFAGRSNQAISTFLKSLPKDLKKKHIRIAWLKRMDDDPHRQTCGKGKKKVVSYRQCISKLQGKTPKDMLRYYMSGKNIRR
ncbi:uncharacterized protein [Haliotis cracherodii]|uniref:uncharacterized protein n=1 Tax=Haliotis cracherodii TaxID=6455 RepID=UPI0039E82CEB